MHDFRAKNTFFIKTVVFGENSFRWKNIDDFHLKIVIFWSENAKSQGKMSRRYWDKIRVMLIQKWPFHGQKITFSAFSDLVRHGYFESKFLTTDCTRFFVSVIYFWCFFNRVCFVGRFEFSVWVFFWRHKI